MVSPVIFSLCITFLGTFVVAEVPSYIPICGRRDPNLSDCIVNSAEALKQKLSEGIPELDVPPIEPLILPEGLPLANSRDVKAVAKNVKMWNIPTWETRDFKADLDNRTFNYKLHFNELRIEGDYEVDARVVVPIHGVGSIDIVAKNIDAEVNFGFKLLNTKNGQQVYFTTMSCKLEIGDYIGSFRATDTASATLSDAINSVINSNRQEVIETIIPVLEKAIASTVLKIANNICKNFTYDELFPDRE